MNALIGLAVGWFTLVWGFIVVMHAKQLRDSGVELSWFWKWLAGVAYLAVIASVLDFAFNVVAGTLMFVELPHEIMFTQRTKRHVSDEGWRGSVARFWARNLNQISPGHV